jgi:quinol-cytochrome oxidoreductase complex cytochrome b subunit
MGLVGVHLVFLHQKGFSNPLGVNGIFNKLLFHPYFSLEDMLGCVFVYDLKIKQFDSIEI